MLSDLEGFFFFWINLQLLTGNVHSGNGLNKLEGYVINLEVSSFLFTTILINGVFRVFYRQQME